MKAALGAAILALFVWPGQEAPQAAKEAISKTRAAASYRTRFKAVVKTPNSDPLILDGESVWVKGGVLFIHYKASGGDEKRIIRVGDEVWLFNEVVEDWVSAAEAGNPGAGRGVQNSDEVLGVLEKHLEKAAFSGEGRTDVALALEGPDIERVMKEQASQGSFDWKNSSASIALRLGEGRVTAFTCEAKLASTDPALAGKKVDYSADVEVVAYDRDTELRFELVDPATKKATPIELSDEVAGAIKKALGK